MSETSNTTVSPRLSKLFQAARDVGRSPAVSLSLGNVVLAAQTAETAGIALTTLTSAATTFGAAYESYTGKKWGIPFYVLSAVNGATAASVIGNGIDQQGLDGLMNGALDLDAESLKTLGAAIAFLGWGAGHLVAGNHERHGTSASYALNNHQTYYGVGDLAAVQGNPVVSAIFALGLAKALTTKPGEIGEVKSVKDYLNKHAQPARMYGAGYMIGSAMSLLNGDHAFAAAQTAWGVGYMNFDPLNRQILVDAYKVLKNNLTGLFAKPTPDLKAIDQLGLLGEVEEMVEGLPKALAQVKDGLWDEAAKTVLKSYDDKFIKPDLDFAKVEGFKETFFSEDASELGRLYNSFSNQDDKQRDGMFAMLVALSRKSEIARDYLYRLHVETDARLMDWSETLGSRARGESRPHTAIDSQVRNAETLLSTLRA